MPLAPVTVNGVGSGVGSGVGVGGSGVGVRIRDDPRVTAGDSALAVATLTITAAPLTARTTNPAMSRRKNLLSTNVHKRTLRLEGEQATSGRRPGDCHEPH